ncbi:hypothetical protein [Peribacillus simplex]|uniref:hypothetical protein n=1 Tax=Peribacillus simplex TaxID=1478 RepID=UPI003D27D583
MIYLNKLELLSKSFGVGLIILGILRFQEGVRVPPEFITGVSLAGFFLTLPDFLEISMLNKRVNKIFHKIYNGTSTIIINLCYIFAIIAILIFPNLNVVNEIDLTIMSRIGDSSTFIALGFSIYVTSQKNKKAAFYEIKKNLEQMVRFLKICKRVQKLF